jgi:hypothetical protein
LFVEGQNDREIQYVDFRVRYKKALHILLHRLRNEAPNVTEDWLNIPARPTSWIGFVPLLYIACPTVVKVVSLLTAISVFFKVFAALWVITGVGSIIILLSIIWMWLTFRAANRRVTFAEMAALQFVVVAIPLIWLAADTPFLYFLIATPFDLAVVITILCSKSYRRWMIAYPYGLGAKN